MGIPFLVPAKGQLISKCLFGVYNFSPKNERKQDLVVKSNFFVRFLGELRIPKSSFEINWPLVKYIVMEQPEEMYHWIGDKQLKNEIKCACFLFLQW